MQEEDYTPQSPTVTVLRPSSSADFHLAEQALARGASSSKYSHSAYSDDYSDSEYSSGYSSDAG